MRTSGTKLLYSKMCAEMVIIMNLYYIKYFVTLAEYKHENKLLKMENELLRDFLRSTERK